MRKISIILFVITLFFFGCGKKSDYITFTGVIEEVNERNILVSTKDLDSSDKARVGFHKDLELNINLVVGQKVEITILPEIREGYPVQVTAVKIKLIEDLPVTSDDMTENDAQVSSAEQMTSTDQSSSIVPTSSSDIKTCWVNGDGVRLRSQPSIDSVILGALYTGELVKLLDRQEYWSKVSVNGLEGYINNKYLSEEQPPENQKHAVTQSSDKQDPSNQQQTEEKRQPEKLNSPKIIVKKAERKLELWDGDNLYDTYSIGLGPSPVGHKAVEGDGRTPEGTYYVCVRNANSRFYKSLGVSYPNKADAKAALDAGTINQSTYNSIASCIEDKRQPPWNTAMGGQIMIHGHGGDRDWTAGCVAVDDDVMDILWKFCPLKTPIIIEP